ncbi:MAG: sulfatase-like hydrolase/transferase [Candidatus Marinimicrobia bacterium]|nr:sulfatase-like hydrolase/transferase [Candidatus Neomarinimicrobiota bacterium]MBT4925711.1 sulfatase-like hydrolase/transferase [Candidatus Neomarinimicrobiota bacterium]MBT7172353.1 sulfatase-like hydrolase/transferase [Candidatus Neomarinimicrobiota bacterium]MBT7433538.1 sulfatase-like hydrolase/transferase [Candidatus Neomarinimicrobiota bacterium]
MKKTTAIIFFLLFIGILGWQNRINITVWAIPKILNIVRPVLSEGSSSWKEGPVVPNKTPDNRPNIILILADDLGFNDVSLYNGGAGSGSLLTPNIDQIAKDGVMFKNGYAANAMCAPSRASIMTGRYSTRFGFEFTPLFPGAVQLMKWIDDIQDNELKIEIEEKLYEDVKDIFSAGIPTEEITIAEALKDVGYYTAHIGKWHLGRVDGSHPNDQGFDDSLFMEGGLYLPENDKRVVNAKTDHAVDSMIWARSQFSASFNKSPNFAPGGYLTDYYTDEAIQVIEKNKYRPFFLYLAHWAVHNPLQALKSDVTAISHHTTGHNLQVYSGMITALDRSVGRIVDALEKNGLTDNTLIIITSDNGGASYIELADINNPYRGWKLTHFEGGTHIPFMAKWPDQIEAGTKFIPVVHHNDIFQTIAAAGNANVPTDRILDGVDFLPFVNGSKDGILHETLFWRQGHQQTVLHQGWKLIRTSKAEQKWLFHLEEDPTEQNNLISDYPDKVKLLEQLLDKHNLEQVEPLWPSVVNAPILIDKHTGQEYEKDDEYIYWPN